MAARDDSGPALLRRYTEEELDAAKISEGGKQAKLDFLNKMVSCVSFALGEKLDVSANKIVRALDLG